MLAHLGVTNGTYRTTRLGPPRVPLNRTVLAVSIIVVAMTDLVLSTSADAQRFIWCKTQFNQCTKPGAKCNEGLGAGRCVNLPGTVECGCVVPPVRKKRHAHP
jgi:hypothetical protein